MSRTPIPFHADDVSALSRSLTSALSEMDHVPGHVEMLNLLSRAVGFRNFQSLRASAEAGQRLMSPAPTPAAVDFALVSRLRRYFDGDGRLCRWPSKFSHQEPCVWMVWSRLPARQVMTERQVNDHIKAAEAIGDHVLLRRELVNYGLLQRTPDGREYRRIERQPPAAVRALLGVLTQVGSTH